MVAREQLIIPVSLCGLRRASLPTLTEKLAVENEGTTIENNPDGILTWFRSGKIMTFN